MTGSAARSFAELPCWSWVGLDVGLALFWPDWADSADWPGDFWPAGSFVLSESGVGLESGRWPGWEGLLSGFFVLLSG